MFRKLGASLLLSASVFSADWSQVSVVADPWCPFNCDADSDAPGIMIELATHAFEQAGIELEYDNINWARSARWVMNGEKNAIVGMGRSPNTEAKFLFPDTPLAFTQVCFYRRQEDSWRFSDARSLSGKTLGWINQYRFGDDAVDQWVRDHQDTDSIVTVAGEATLINALISMLNRERIDTFGEVRSTVEHANQVLSDQPNAVIAGCLPQIDDVYIAFTPDSDASRFYANALDNGMQKLLQDTATLQALFDRYGLNLDDYLTNLRASGLYPPQPD